MKIIITKWALDSYMELLRKKIFTKEEFISTMYEDVLELRTGPTGVRFQNNKFWGPAKVNADIVDKGYKMKWRQVGTGRVQLRAYIAMIDGDAYICHAGVKSSAARDTILCRMLRTRIKLIQQKKYQTKGVL